LRSLEKEPSRRESGSTCFNASLALLACDHNNRKAPTFTTLAQGREAGWPMKVATPETHHTHTPRVVS
jgi:hypothetical protein